MTTAPLAPVSDLDRAIAAHRAALLRQDAATLSIVERRWRAVQRRLQGDIDALLRSIDADTTPNKLRRLQRYKDLLAQVEAQVQSYADSLAPTITAGQSSAVTMAAAHARAQVLAQLGDTATWNTLPVAATQEMIGRLSDSSPLVEYLQKFGPAAAASAEDILVAGVARGIGVKVLARELEQVFGKAGTADPGKVGRQAMLTARQSIMSSYRSASLETYKANSDILEGWTWHSALNKRTCFPAGTLITTMRGLVPIEQIQVGELVLTHAGKYQPVVATSCRPYSGVMVEVSTAQASVTATSDHPFLGERQGQLDWIEAADLEPGGLVASHRESTRYVAQHISRNQRAIQWSSDKANNGIPMRLQVQSLSLISLFHLIMPVWFVNLKHNILIRQKEVNRVATDLVFLNKGITETIKTLAGISLWFRLAFILAITPNRAESASSGFTGRRAKLNSAMDTRNHDRRATAFFRAMCQLPAMSVGYFPTSLAGNIKRISSLALDRTESTRLSGQCKKDLAAPFTRIWDFHRARCIVASLRTKLAQCACIGCESGPALFTDALNTGLRGSFAFTAMWVSALMLGIAGVRAKPPIAFSQPSRRDGKGLTAYFADKLRAFVEPAFHGLFTALRRTVKPLLVAIANINPSISTTDSALHFELSPLPLNIQPFHTSIIHQVGSHYHPSITVYNIEVDEDHSYVANGFVVHNCAICWAMHGSLHKVTETFSSHISCRCSPVPRTKSWEALGLKGIPETRPTIEDGATAFARLSEAEQRLILGPGRLALYKAGTPLTAFVQETHDRKWGDGLRIRPLSSKD